ncbi:MAG: cytochrome c biogenesis protein CcdA [Actinomycetota bacterium]|nr:cytochrome c biogenesis protein CcdA [Actinomycetota bacterium]
MTQLRDVIQNPLFAILIVGAAGLATSLGPCTFARAVTFMGYVGADKGMSRAKGFYLAFLLLVGLTVSYSSLGLIGFAANNLFKIGTGLYYATGAVMLMMGLHFAGLVRIRIPAPTKLRELKAHYSTYQGPAGSLMLGGVFGFMICPCCLPGLLAIFALTFAKGQVAYGVLLVFAYTLGHGIPLLAVGIFSGALNVMSSIQRWREHLNLATGTIMIIGGLLFLWIV